MFERNSISSRLVVIHIHKSSANWSHSRRSQCSGFLSVLCSSVCHGTVHFHLELMMMITLNFLTDLQRFIKSFPKNFPKKIN